MCPDAAVMPDIAEIHRCVPDLRTIFRQQAVSVITGGRPQEGVINDNISRAAKQAQLDVAHTACEEVYILRYEQHRGLIVDMLSPALIGECEQQRTGSAGGVVHGHPALLFYPRRHIRRIGHRGHHPADTVRSEELSFPFVSEAECHKKLTEEVLLGIALQFGYDLKQHICKDFQLLSGILLCAAAVHFFPGLGLRASHRVGDCDGRHDDEVLPDIPAGILPTQPFYEADDILLTFPSDVPQGVSHDLALLVRCFQFCGFAQLRSD